MPAKRVRKAKKVARRPAAAEGSAVDNAEGEKLEASSLVRQAPAEPLPRARKQQKKFAGDGELALLQRCGGLVAQEAATTEVSPPLEKVFARHSAFAKHAEAVAARRPSSLATGARHADGSDGAHDLDWLSRDVAVWKMQGGSHLG